MIETLKKSLADKLHAKPEDALSAIRIVSLALDAVTRLYPHLSASERRTVIILSIEKIAAGGDGVLGTNDDVISLQVLQHLKTLLGTNMLSDLISALDQGTEALAKCKCWPF